MSSVQEQGLTPSATLLGARKVATLLLAVGRPRAAQLLQRFEPDEVKLIRTTAQSVRPIKSADLANLVEEFAGVFADGVRFVDSVAGIEGLLAEAFDEEQVAELLGEAEAVEEPPLPPVWPELANLDEEVFANFVANEHPQSIAVILTKGEAESAAGSMTSLPVEVRNSVLCRMLALDDLDDDVLLALENGLREDLLSGSGDESEGARQGIADILNRLDKVVAEQSLDDLSVQRPGDAEALKKQLFNYEDMAGLPQATVAIVLDQVPTEQLILSLRGVDAEFQDHLLGTLGARTRRMVEAELQAGVAASERDVQGARREIAANVLSLAAAGQIELTKPEQT